MTDDPIQEVDRGARSEGRFFECRSVLEVAPHADFSELTITATPSENVRIVHESAHVSQSSDSQIPSVITFDEASGITFDEVSGSLANYTITRLGEDGQWREVTERDE